MNTNKGNRWEYGNGSKDAARLSMLMANTGASGDPSTRASIPMPPLERKGEEKWDARGAMTLEGYQRLRRGYERGINPEALERMEEHGEETRQFPEAAPQYDVPLYADHGAAESAGIAGEDYSADNRAGGTQRRTVYSDELPVGGPSVERSRPVVAPSHSRRMGPIAVTLVLFVGIVGALLLYAGGAEYLTEFFRGKKPVPDENLTLITERPGAESAVDPAGTLAPGEEMEIADIAGANGAVGLEDESAGAAAEDAEESEHAREQEELEAEKARRDEQLLAEKNKAEQARAEKEKAAAELKAQRAKEEAEAKAKAAAAKAQAKPAATSTTATKPTTAATSTPKVTAVKAQTAATKAFTVQVRATPNKEEADRVARTLRAKGGSDVHIIAAEKDGETVYRVRFGSFGSAEEGKTKAGEMGFANVWVIKR